MNYEIKTTKTVNSLNLLLFLLLFFQVLKVLFHAINHPFFKKVHHECESTEDIINPPFSWVFNDAHNRNEKKNCIGCNQPKVEHYFIV